MSVGLDSRLVATFDKPMVIQSDDNREASVLVKRQDKFSSQPRAANPHAAGGRRSVASSGGSSARSFPPVPPPSFCSFSPEGLMRDS